MFAEGQIVLYADKNIGRVRRCRCRKAAGIGYPPRFHIVDLETGEEFTVCVDNGLFTETRWDEAARMAANPIPYRRQRGDV